MTAPTARIYPFTGKEPVIRHIKHTEIPGWHWDEKDEKYWVPYTFEDLNGNRPYKHSESILRDMEDLVVIEPGLVFMRKDSRLLVVVKRAHPEEEHILFAPYLLSVQCSFLAYEKRFRDEYVLWDDVGKPPHPAKRASLTLVK